MNATSKQSEDSDIARKPDQFLRARVKLAAYYSAGFFAALLLFSGATYIFFSQTFSYEREFDGDSAVFEPERQQEIESRIVNEADDYLLRVLVGMDILLALFMVFASYALARKTLAPIEHAYERQRRFVADAAHELRTPLTVMKSGIELALSTERKPQEYRSFLEDSLEEVDSMSETASDLLFLARADAGTQERFEELDLSDLLSRQVEHMQAYANDHSVMLSGEIKPGIRVRGRRTDLKRLTGNIIKNAIDYNVAQGSVDVRLSMDADVAMLSVTDTGVGIPAQHLPLVFDRFYKADSARSVRKGTGSGLGLSIVSDIARTHGARIDLKSEPGKGTCVQVMFRPA